MSGWSRFFGLFTATALAVACYDPKLVDCVVRCGNDGACPNDMRCSNGFCASELACKAADPEAPVPPQPTEPCDPGETRCAKLDSVERCDEAGAAWITVASCGGQGSVCQNSGCLACAPGAVRCVGAGAFQRCAADGAWGSDRTSCEADAPRCAAGVCVPSVEVSAGGAFACARLRDGAIECWGANDFGQLGVGDRAERGSTPEGPAFARIALAAAATRVCTGGAHACALLDSGRIQCWGANGRGQLGLGDVEPRGDQPDEMGDALPALQLGRRDRPVAVAAGDRHTCVLFDRGEIACFGANESGQLGIGSTEPKGDDPDEMGEALASVDLGPGAAAVAVRAGHNHNCALLSTGSVKCWGENEHGQLGVGDTQARGDEPGELGSRLPAADLGPSGLRAIDVSAGNNHTCALLEDRSIVCWGANVRGQLGTGDRRGRGASPPSDDRPLTPVDLGSATGTVQISVGANHSCALTRDRGVSCWGLNLAGALGQGDLEPRGDDATELGDNLEPVGFGHAGGAPLRALAVSAGVDFSCAALDTGAIKCWGENGRGQLGIGDRESRGDAPDELADALASVAIE